MQRSTYLALVRHQLERIGVNFHFGNVDGVRAFACPDSLHNVRLVFADGSDVYSGRALLAALRAVPVGFSMWKLRERLSGLSLDVLRGYVRVPSMV